MVLMSYVCIKRDKRGCEVQNSIKKEIKNHREWHGLSEVIAMQ